MILSAIAAMSKNFVIGNNNQLPWSLPEDMKFFKQKTNGKIIIMGRKTFESFHGKPLPNRIHIIISRTQNLNSAVNTSKNIYFVNEIPAAIKLARDLIALKNKESKFEYNNPVTASGNEKEAVDENEIEWAEEEEVFVIGGAHIYKEFLPLIDRLYLTILDKDFLGDTFFPDFSKQNFKLIFEEKHDSQRDQTSFRFCTFERSA